MIQSTTLNLINFAKGLTKKLFNSHVLKVCFVQKKRYVFILYHIVMSSRIRESVHLNPE